MSSGLRYSRIADLSFRVLGRPPHPDWFTTRAHRRVAQDGWQADVRIIDGGHAILWRAGTIRLAEVVTSSHAPMPDSTVLFQAPVRHERATVLRPGEGVEYQTCFEVENADPEVFAHLCDEMTLDGSRDRLLYRSSGSNRLAPPGVSHVVFETRARGLLVHTFHSFPADRAIVRTQSLFEIPAAQR